MILIILLFWMSCIWFYRKTKPYRRRKELIAFWVMVFIPGIGTMYHWRSRSSFKERINLRKTKS
ncbi:hypothetical protein IL45_13735 [Nonlabens ulvanivorans]|uniref:Uncharacterized protein n=1 Tax=Nonlabens ulvanivorans TaxID=906888 RepID=A0A084JW43_NONUL|nr:hypothetical protein IL45_13735 [Nonlabens ulvanivorans]